MCRLGVDPTRLHPSRCDAIRQLLHAPFLAGALAALSQVEQGPGDGFAEKRELGLRGTLEDMTYSTYILSCAGQAG